MAQNKKSGPEVSMSLIQRNGVEVMSFKLTFNKPAVRQFIDGEDAVGLRIKIEDGKVYFHTVKNVSGSDAVEIEGRSRGGCEVQIEGTMADELRDTLSAHGKPFFMLKKAAKGWFVAEPYTQDRVPPRFDPHMRVWLPRPASTNRPKIEVTNLNLQDVADAHNLLTDFESDRRPGRPSREVLAARDTIAVFRDFATKILPQTGAHFSVDSEKLKEAARLISEALHDEEDDPTPVQQELERHHAH